MKKEQYKTEYYVMMTDKISGDILLMSGVFYNKTDINLHSIALALYFEYDDEEGKEYLFDQLSFDIVERSIIQKKTNLEENYNNKTNKEYAKKFDEFILVLSNKIERSDKYSKSELDSFYSIFLYLKTIVSKNIFVDKFMEEKKINFVAKKFKSLIEKSFIGEEDKDWFLEQIKIFLSKYYFDTKDNEEFEICSNLRKMFVELDNNESLIKK